MKYYGKIALLYVAALAMCLLSPWLQAQITLQMLKDANPDMNWKALERGQIVSNDLPDQEVNKAALAVIVAVKLPASKEQVLEHLKQLGGGGETIAIDTSSGESIADSFQSYQIDNRGTINVDWFRKPKADGTFNVSREELEQLSQAALRVDPADPGDIEPFNQAVRGFLIGRLEEYRRGGLNSISPYDVDGQEIYPGDYLADSLEPLSMLKKVESDFYNAFLAYPDMAEKHYTQEFFVVREMDGERPVTSLKHWMVNPKSDSVLIAERKFYISHSLDAMHTLILALQPDDHTYLCMVNLSFTQKVAGMGSFVAHKVGRHKVKENILPIFTSLQKRFN